MPIDYRNMKEGWKPGESPADQAQAPGGRWWNLKDETSLGKSVITITDSLKQQAAQRHQMNLVHARLYGNVDIISFGARDYARSPVTLGVIPNRIAFNIVATCIETLGSKIGKQRPRPSFQTNGGSWPAQQRARRANQWTQGLFYETQIHEKAKKVRLAAYTFGTGALKVWVNDEHEVHCEPAFIDDIYVDDADGIDGKPRQLFQRFLVDRDVLIARFPKAQTAIEQADSDQTDKPNNGTVTRVEVWEGWHLPSGKKAKDGRHVIVVRGGGVLLDEAWELDCFPFVFRRYRPRLQGFWGQGISEILTGIQVELNRLTRSVSEQLRRRGRGRIFAQAGTIDENAIDNSYSPIVKTKGPPGQVLMIDNQNAVAGEEFQQIDRLYQKGFQEVGLSELSVAAKKPSGLDAAVALREFNDIESERFALDAQADENFYLDFTYLSMKLVNKFAPKTHKVRMPSKQFIKYVEWKDIALKDDEAIIQMFPVSSLPSQPGARLQRVQELLGGGFIDMPTAKRLLEFPDIEAEQNLANAVLDDVDACISMILDDDTPKLPSIEKYQDTSLIVSRATSSYLYAKHHGADEERLQMMRDYIDLATNEMTVRMAGMAAMSAGLPPTALGGGAPSAPAGGGSVQNTVNVQPQAPTPAVPPVVA